MSNLDLIKNLLNLTDNSQEPILSYYINMVETKVRVYCNYSLTEPIPKQLNDIIVDIALSQCRTAISTNTSSTTSVVTPVTAGLLKKKTIGGTSYEYDTSSEAITASSTANSTVASTKATDFLSDYITLLNALRKKRITFI